jgi:hypothetical protein
MRQIRATFDRMATLAALRLLAWVGKHVDPAQQLWLEALRAELDAIDGGIARLGWAVGGLRLIWFERRRHLVNATYRYGPVLLPGLEAALFVGLTWSLIQHDGSIVVVLLELTGLSLIVAVPVLIALVHVLRTTVTRLAARDKGSEPERHVRPLLPLMFGILSLAALLVMCLYAPMALDQLMVEPGSPTAGVVVRSTDHHTAEAVVDQTVSLSHSEVYLTTQVRPLAVNGVPLVQLLQSMRQHNDLQVLVNKFTGIQGYDLAHGQFPDGAGMGFAPEWGKGGSGYNGSGTGPPGRLLDAHDARTLNVLIPRDYGGLSYLTFNGDTITVQSLVTGQMLDLHVVGEYESDGSVTHPLFGMVLADDSVVQTLSGGHPSYAYGLHLDMNQLQTVFERLHSRVPTALLYDFMTDPIGPDTEPGYALFTRPYPVNLLGYADSNLNPPILLAVSWALLIAMIIVLNREARTLIDQSGLGNRRKG